MAAAQSTTRQRTIHSFMVRERRIVCEKRSHQRTRRAKQVQRTATTRGRSAKQTIDVCCMHHLPDVFPAAICAARSTPPITKSRIRLPALKGFFGSSGCWFGCCAACGWWCCCDCGCCWCWCGWWRCSRSCSWCLCFCLRCNWCCWCCSIKRSRSWKCDAMARRSCSSVGMMPPAAYSALDVLVAFNNAPPPAIVAKLSRLFLLDSASSLVCCCCSSSSRNGMLLFMFGLAMGIVGAAFDDLWADGCVVIGVDEVVVVVVVIGWCHDESLFKRNASEFVVRRFLFFGLFVGGCGEGRGRGVDERTQEKKWKRVGATTRAQKERKETNKQISIRCEWFDIKTAKLAALFALILVDFCLLLGPIDGAALCRVYIHISADWWWPPMDCVWVNICGSTIWMVHMFLWRTSPVSG